jgi:hypothetical protein
MSPKTMRIAAAVTVAAVLAGCAEEREPVNRVQPYALKKSYFVGEDLVSPTDDPEFWAQATLVDVGYGATQDGLFTSTYVQPVARIRWQITEDMLFGRLAYERVEDSDGRGLGRATQDGVIVVAYPIESHFDIVRQYNPTTGEEINVIEENTTDRPWNEREYMRVDWSRNLNTDSYDFDMLSMLGVLGSIVYEPLEYDVTDPHDPNAPVFDLEHGYFDVTNKAFAQPQVVDISSFGWGFDKLPACWFDPDFMGGSFPWGSCNPTELTIRQSFRKVDVGDFEPKDWDGWRFQAYGGFYMDRFGYTRNYGMSDDLWHRMLSHYQIWKRSHHYENPDAMTGAIQCYTPETTPYGQDPHRDRLQSDGETPGANGTEDECEGAGPGSRCDTFTQKCTLPYAEREPVTIVWYYSHESNQDFFEPTAEAAHEWEVVLRAAVRTAQYAECRATGGTQEACVERFPIWFGQMDDFQDARWLAAEVDKCRNGKAYAGANCDALAVELGEERGMDPGVISVARMPEMIVLCHSPVQADDPAPCSGPRLPVGITAAQCEAAYQDAASDPQLLATCRAALNVRRGDLRYNQVNGIDKPQTLSPWGIYTDSIDPITGMTIASSNNIWTYVNDLWSQDVVDKIRFLKGEYSAEDVTEGEFVHDWSLAAQAAAGGGVAPLLTRAEVAERIGQFAGAEGPAADPASLPPEVRAQIQEFDHQLRGVRASLYAPSNSSALYAARRRAASGTAFEAELMTPMVRELHGVEDMPMEDAILDIASPLRGGNPGLRRELNQLKEEALARRGTCILHPDEVEAPFSIYGLAEILQDKFGEFNPRDPLEVQQARAERMRRYLAHRVHYSILVHEMGHGMAMRHNFVGSSDAYSYQPQYWQLRTRNGTVTTECTDLAANGNDCVGPRWFDPITDEERDNLIWMFSLGSIMDYPGEATQDTTGVGVYDVAAVRMLFGETVAVNANPEFDVDQPKGKAMLAKVDGFGGILGISHGYDENGDGQDENFHYSQLQVKYGMIQDCEAISDPEDYRPADWDEEENGVWHPVFDGMLVRVNGRWSHCRQPKVDYVPWTSLRMPTIAESGPYYYGGPSVDRQGRTRVPYGFATDHWADLGNVSVYRHDNGADPYEIFNFLMSSQEVWQIFETYRRHRSTFSVSGAANRILVRYNAKIRDGAKGFGLIKNLYDDFSLEAGYDADTYWPVAAAFYPDNTLAAGLAFDHFVRQLDRPEMGPHFKRPYEEFLRSSRDTVANPGATKVIVPNGATGVQGALGLGGKLVENLLADDMGEYDTWYTVNAGSYYDKINAAMLMTESVDNFISQTRNDFVDPRYRSVSVADLFPDGYRRWLANNLTGDELLKGPRIAADEDGDPLVDFQKYSTWPIGWITWWTREPQVCFPGEGSNICSAYHMPTSDPFHPRAPENTAVLDPEVGWEQQKFLIAWTMLYLPENQKMNWLDLLRLYQLGADPYPVIEQRLEFHSPDGKIYIAKTFGKEVIFGKTVQRGIAARVLEWANELLAAAYVLEEDPDRVAPDLDGDGEPDWPVPAPGDDGQLVVKWDQSLALYDAEGTAHPEGLPGCNADDYSECTCSANRACMALQRYVSVPAYLREAVAAYQLGEPDMRGVY